MLTKDEILNNLSTRKSYFEKKYHITKIGLFGSYSQGLESESSDIDILVEFESNTEDLFELKKNLKNELSLLFGKAVDICREKYIKPYFRKQILESAIYVN